jgi:L-threonylcarbamoyladenylate synthase
MISLAELENAIGPVRVFEGSQEGGHAAPGMHARHYSPRAAVFLNEIPSGGRGVYLYLSTGREGVHSVRMPPEPDAYAAALYRTLHDADAAGWDWIAVELPPEGIEWMAIRDRLGRMPGR